MPQLHLPLREQLCEIIMWSALHSASLEGISAVSHASLLCKIVEAMNRYTKGHIGSLLAYFFLNYVFNGWFFIYFFFYFVGYLFDVTGRPLEAVLTFGVLQLVGGIFQLSVPLAQYSMSHNAKTETHVWVMKSEREINLFKGPRSKPTSSNSEYTSL